jgi:sugar (pentulose or hexulose) kinase
MISCGGTARSTLWAQIKADILDLPVDTVDPADTTAWGTVLLSAQALSLEITTRPFTLTNFQPSRQQSEIYHSGYQRFCQLTEMLSTKE